MLAAGSRFIQSTLTSLRDLTGFGWAGVLIALLALTGLALAPLPSQHGRNLVSLFRMVAYLLSTLWIIRAWRARQSNPGPRHWNLLRLLLISGLVVAAASELVYLIARLGKSGGASGDLIFWMTLIAEAAWVVAMALMPKIPSTNRATGRMVVDFFVLVLGFALLLWLSFWEIAKIHLEVADSWGSKLHWIAIPCVRLALFGLCVWRWLNAPSLNIGRVCAWLASATAVAMVADALLVAWSHYEANIVNPIADTLHAMEAIMIWIAARALCQRESDRYVSSALMQDRASHLQWLPLVFVAALAFGFLFAAWRLGDVSPIALAASLILVAMMMGLKRWFVQREHVDIVRSQSNLEANARIATLMDHMSDAVFLLDGQDRIQLASHGASRLLGTGSSSSVGKRFGQYLHGDDIRDAILAFESISRTPNGHVRRQWRLRDERGQTLWSEVDITNRLDDPEVGGMIVNLRDVSEEVQLQEQLRDETFNDRVTGLANRGMFYARTEAALRQCRDDPATGGLAVILIRLDETEPLNPVHGTLDLDVVVRGFSRALQRSVRKGDTVARISEREFAILLERLQRAAEATYVVEHLLAELQKPVLIETVEHRLHASIGVAMADPDDRVDGVLRKADVARHRAHSMGRSRYQFFDPELHRVLESRIELRGQLQEALTRGDFRLVFQPILNLSNQRPVAVEALLRWHRSEGHLVPADTLIRVAEESGLMLGVGRWVINEALDQYLKLRDKLSIHPLPAMAINISPLQLDDPEFIENIQTQLQSRNIPASDLILEIHASVLNHLESQTHVIEQLAALGVQLVLDDFGSGAVSMAQFSELPLVGVKLDRSFVADVASTPSAVQLVEGIVAMCRALDLRVAVKGAESFEQLECLVAMGCEEAQGFLFSPAVPAGELALWLNRKRDRAIP